MSKKTSNTEIAKFKGTTDLTARASSVGRGSENVTANDLAIPRLKLLQMISEEIIPGGPKQIEGATAGMIMNSLNNELNSGLFVVNLNFTPKVVAWKKRKLGGGLEAQASTREEVIAELESRDLKLEEYDISDNPQHLVLILDDEGKPKGTALLDMPGTKVKVSKVWNSLIQEQEDAGNPRFGCIWQLGVQSETNPSGNYFNYDIKLVAVAPDEMYEIAEGAFNTFFGNPEQKAA